MGAVTDMVEAAMILGSPGMEMRTRPGAGALACCCSGRLSACAAPSRCVLLKLQWHSAFVHRL